MIFNPETLEFFFTLPQDAEARAEGEQNLGLEAREIGIKTNDEFAHVELARIDGSATTMNMMNKNMNQLIQDIHSGLSDAWFWAPEVWLCSLGPAWNFQWKVWKWNSFSPSDSPLRNMKQSNKEDGNKSWEACLQGSPWVFWACVVSPDMGLAVVAEQSGQLGEAQAFGGNAAENDQDIRVGPGGCGGG